MEQTRVQWAIARRSFGWAATRLVGLVFLCALAVPHGYAQGLDSSKEKAVQDLVAIKTRQEATTWDRLAEPLFSAARASNLGAPPETWEELRSYINGVILKAAAQPGGQRNELIIRRYNDRFTDDEIHQLLAFFSSDVGKKFTVESSVLQQDLDKANAMFMMRLVPQITRDVERFFQERGYGCRGEACTPISEVTYCGCKVAMNLRRADASLNLLTADVSVERERERFP